MKEAARYPRWTRETEVLCGRALEMSVGEDSPLDEAFVEDARRVLAVLADAGLLSGWEWQLVRERRWALRHSPGGPA